MATGNAHITYAIGGYVGSNVATTVAAGTSILTVSQMRQKMGQVRSIGKPISLTDYVDRVSPPRCGKRKGGPRSKIFCEQFDAGKHTVHVGRSNTGRWYTWSDNG